MSEITLADIRPGTIIVTHGKLAIVEEVSPRRPKNPIAYKNNTDHRGYICGIESVQAVLGDVDLSKWKQGVTPPLPKVTRDDPWAMPENLKAMDLKPGVSVIVMRHGRGKVQALYTGYSYRRPKYPVSYEVNGKKWKGAASSVVSKVRDNETTEAAA
jgi:hypothetical protein